MIEIITTTIIMIIIILLIIIIIIIIIITLAIQRRGFGLLPRKLIHLFIYGLPTLKWTLYNVNAPEWIGKPLPVP